MKPTKAKTESNRGTVKTVVNRKTGAIAGFRAYLPRELSTAPPGTKHPERYQQPLRELCPTELDARKLLNAALSELRGKGTLTHGLTFAHYASALLRSRKQDALREHRGSDAKANKRIKTWKSIERRWLPHAMFHEWQMGAIGHADVQHYVTWLRDEAEKASGEPLSGTYVRQVVAFVKAAFEKAEIHPNPCTDLRLPKKGQPDVQFLDLDQQRALLTSDAIAMDDRVMVGCGMGAGLRVGELLSMEASDVHLDDQDPHLMVRYGGSDRSPTKGKRVRRVELFDPGLGFWRLWMREHYAGGVAVFDGPQGGYRKHWPDSFPGWADIARVERLSSHIMRHTYAVSMLSGLWGYDPRTLEFVGQQLGHRETSTTERYYGAFAPGTWRKEVREMTGRAPRRVAPMPAGALLGSTERAAAEGVASTGAAVGVSTETTETTAGRVVRGKRAGARTPQVEASTLEFLGGNALFPPAPSLTQNAISCDKTGVLEASTPQVEASSLAARLRAAMAAIEANDPTGYGRLVDAAAEALPLVEAVEAGALVTRADAIRDEAKRRASGAVR